ncbi:T9SS type A sorting domain-containing protein [Cytophagaceae bacterium ABcell3]|nr:T9SS type A sorting domain-containing protein [Cytophagaceae bacterium ABcell3]
MNKVFLSLLLAALSSFMAYAQSWNPGATWNYSSIPGCWPDGSAKYTFKYESDTIVGGKQCQKVVEDKVFHPYSLGDVPQDSILSEEIHITHFSGDTVFYYHNEAFYTLYNFGAEVGDQWLVRVNEQLGCNDSSFVQVDRKGTVKIGEEEFRWIEVSPVLGSSYGLHGKIIEGLGMVDVSISDELIVQNMGWGFFIPYQVDCQGREQSCLRRKVVTGYKDDIFGTSISKSDLKYFEDREEDVWVKPGATWHYVSCGGDRRLSWRHGLHRLVYESDTLVDGKNCQKIVHYVAKRRLYPDNSGDNFYKVYEEEIPLRSLITYVDDDKVFYLEDGGFYLLYDFAAEVGDSWLISPHGDSYVEVTQKGEVVVNGRTLRWVDIAPKECGVNGINSRIVEGIGAVGNYSDAFGGGYASAILYPIRHRCPDEPVNSYGQSFYSFQCFQEDGGLEAGNLDDNCGLDWFFDDSEVGKDSPYCYSQHGYDYFDWDGSGEEAPKDDDDDESKGEVTGIGNEKEVTKIYPNPVETELVVNNHGAFNSYVIYRLTGEKVLGGKLIEGVNSLYTDGLVSGTYMIQLSRPDGQDYHVFIKQ